MQGEGGKDAVPAGRGRCGTLRGGRGWLGRVLVGLGWLRCGSARQVLDMVLAGKAPASAGRVRGQELSGRVGEHLGSKGKLQDKVALRFAAGWDKVGMVGGMPCHCYLG